MSHRQTSQTCLRDSFKNAARASLMRICSARGTSEGAGSAAPHYCSAHTAGAVESSPPVCVRQLPDAQ